METLRQVVVLIHVVGFALLFGAWAAQAFGGKRRFTKVMDYGLVVAGLAGLALAAPWGISWEPGASFYTKVAVKLVVLLIIGALLGIGAARQKRGDSIPSAMFWLVGVLAFANAAIGLLWH